MVVVVGGIVEVDVVDEVVDVSVVTGSADVAGDVAGSLLQAAANTALALRSATASRRPTPWEVGVIDVMRPPFLQRLGMHTRHAGSLRT
ncbi:MAG: hypothetical protein RLY45_1669 [Actinomycetota bacterium]|jgi:hypothetical protein